MSGFPRNVYGKQGVYYPCACKRSPTLHHDVALPRCHAQNGLASNGKFISHLGGRKATQADAFVWCTLCVCESPKRPMPSTPRIDAPIFVVAVVMPSRRTATSSVGEFVSDVGCLNVPENRISLRCVAMCVCSQYACTQPSSSAATGCAVISYGSAGWPSGVECIYACADV